ncbi:MAG: hypothetical protein JWL58_4111 [Streptosporangiaceae bacterium]|nr:hypothetical protein [Streptosporangiaceae bacterium]
MAGPVEADAGADHAGIQILTTGTRSPMPGYRILATTCSPR